MGVDWGPFVIRTRKQYRASGTRFGGRDRSESSIAGLAPGIDDRSVLTVDNRDADARTKAFAFLVIAVVLKSVGPGVVNFAVRPHPPPPADAVIFSPLALQVSLLASGLLLLVSAYIVVRFGLKRMYLSGSIVMLLTLAIVTQLRMSASPGLDIDTLAALASIVAVVLAVCALQPSLSDLRLIGLAAALVAVYSAAIYIIRPENALYPISGGGPYAPAKAIVGGIVLAGPMSHSNTLGSFLALAFPFIGLWSSRPRRLLGYGAVLSVIVLSASRTALIAVGVIVTFALLRRLAAPFRTRLAAVIALSIGGASLVALPLLVTDPLAFSTRAGAWQAALNVWRNDNSLLFGVGAYWHSRIATSVGWSASSGHNLFVQWGVTGGLLMLALGLALLVMLSRKSLSVDGSRAFPVATSYVLGLLTLSITEFTLPFTVASQLFLGTGLVISALLVARETPRRTDFPESPGVEGGVTGKPWSHRPDERGRLLPRNGGDDARADKESALVVVESAIPKR